jgi:uncharacterized membrane protein (UPF0127 family)
MSRVSLLWLVCLFASASCGEAQDVTDYSAVMRFDSTTVQVRTARGVVALHVQLAESTEQRTMGLMERTSLADSAGMLFLYDHDEPADAGFWMYRTRIPLDIAFLYSTGVVVATRRMEPCRATLAAGCPGYAPGVAYRAALEVNAGALNRFGIGIGSRVSLPVRRRTARVR